MSPRHNRPKATPQQTKAKVTHRPVDEIKRDIADSPAQALPALQAELAAALDADRTAP